MAGQVIQVGIVALHRAVRAGLRSLLLNDAAVPDPACPPLEVILEAPRLSDLGSLPADLDILLVISAEATSSDLKRLLVGREGQVALLLLAESAQVAPVWIDLPLRAWGVISLDATVEELLAAVRALSEGLWVGAPELIRRMLAPWTALPRQLPVKGTAAESGELSPVETLTERESEVLQYLARGMANKQIAMQLGISEHTVKFHVSSIFAKLGVTNRTEAVRLGVRYGLISL